MVVQQGRSCQPLAAAAARRAFLVHLTSRLTPRPSNPPTGASLRRFPTLDVTIVGRRLRPSRYGLVVRGRGAMNRRVASSLVDSRRRERAERRKSRSRTGGGSFQSGLRFAERDTYPAAPR